MKLKFQSPKYLLTLAGTITLGLCTSSASGDTATYNTAGTVNWTCPAGVTSVQVECWGGGGAGGAGRKDNNTGANTSQNGAGGGGGAYARKVSVPVSPGTNYTITIPAAAVSGTNGTTTNNAGAVNGGTVQFLGDSSVTVKAAGGNGGACSYVTGSNSTIGASPEELEARSPTALAMLVPYLRAVLVILALSAQ